MGPHCRGRKNEKRAPRGPFSWCERCSYVQRVGAAGGVGDVDAVGVVGVIVGVVFNRSSRRCWKYPAGMGDVSATTWGTGPTTTLFGCTTTPTSGGFGGELHAPRLTQTKKIKTKASNHVAV